MTVSEGIFTAVKMPEKAANNFFGNTLWEGQYDGCR